MALWPQINWCTTIPRSPPSVHSKAHPLWGASASDPTLGLGWEGWAPAAGHVFKSDRENSRCNDCAMDKYLLIYSDVLQQWNLLGESRRRNRGFCLFFHIKCIFLADFPFLGCENLCVCWKYDIASWGLLRKNTINRGEQTAINGNLLKYSKWQCNWTCGTASKKQSTEMINDMQMLQLAVHQKLKYETWINKPLGCFLRGAPFKYHIIAIWGVPPS